MWDSLRRFAMDRVDDIEGAYGAADNQLGGILPGGTALDAGGLARTIAKDALPGSNSSSFNRTASGSTKANGLIGEALEGDAIGVGVRANAGKYTAKGREFLVEEGLEKGLRYAGEKIGKRLGASVAGGPVGIALSAYDTVNDAKGAYNTLVASQTGSTFTDNVADTVMRNSPGSLDRIEQMEPQSVAPADGSIPQIVQGTATPAYLEPFKEVSNRVNEAVQDFNPLRGEFGFSEIFQGR